MAYPEAILLSLEEGVVVLARRCPHLGNRMEWCESSQRFECPSHGSQFNAVGERKGGPAPRGMTLIPIRKDEDGTFSVVPAYAVPGVPDGADSTGQASEGAHCVSGP